MTQPHAYHLTMVEVSAYFHLNVVAAARELGVSVTTLKRECKRLGLRRWPHRELSSVESTWHGLEQALAVGQGAGREQLPVAFIESEVSRLHQIVNGTPAQVTHTMPGVGTYQLEMTDLFPHFGLTLINAARKLGVSQTTLKKECRRLGLTRWPGRNVRSSLSKIKGLRNALGGLTRRSCGPRASAA